MTDSPITTVDSFHFLGTTITQDLKWEPTISSLIKKAQQRMYFLRQLMKAKLPVQMMVQFYTAIIEFILTSSITVWYAGATPLRQEATVHPDQNLHKNSFFLSAVGLMNT